MGKSKSVKSKVEPKQPGKSREINTLLQYMLDLLQDMESLSFHDTQSAREFLDKIKGEDPDNETVTSDELIKLFDMINRHVVIPREWVKENIYP